MRKKTKKPMRRSERGKNEEKRHSIDDKEKLVYNSDFFLSVVLFPVSRRLKQQLPHQPRVLRGPRARPEGTLALLLLDGGRVSSGAAVAFFSSPSFLRISVSRERERLGTRRDVPRPRPLEEDRLGPPALVFAAFPCPGGAQEVRGRPRYDVGGGGGPAGAGGPVDCR